jgi:monoamine oxidase
MRLARFANRRGAPPLDELVEIAPTMSKQGRWTRRRFLKTSGAATLALAGGGLLTSCARMKGAPRIAIIGAGLAGLNAAYQLKKLGHRADVYEASKRTGGRIYTVKDALAPGLVTEVGGEWLNATDEDTLSLAEEFGLHLSDMWAPSEVVGLESLHLFEGKRYNEPQLIEAFQKRYNEPQLIEAFQPIAALMEDDLAAFEIWDNDEEEGAEEAEARVEHLDGISVAEYLEDIGATGWVRTLLDVTTTVESSMPADQQSAINLVYSIAGKPGDRLPGFLTMDFERYKIVEGCQEVTNGLAERLDEGQVKFGHRLEAVRSRGEGFTLTFQDPSGAASDVKADFVIMTVPFSILRDIEMQMELPDIKKKAIAELGYGSNSKLALGVHRRVWREQGYQGNTYSDEPFQSMYDNSENEGYLGEIGGFTLYSGGQAGIDVGEGTAQDQVERLMPGVEKAYPGVTAELNGNVQRFVWHSYPFAKGSVPCRKIGQWTTIAYTEGDPVGNMFFAGDHCSWDFGFINGAAESGRRAAEAIAARLGGKSVSET